MAKLIELVMALVAYFCVATVITAALMVGYLWRTDHLNNEKMFRLVAVMQDVDLEQIAKVDEKPADAVPPAESSLHEVMHRQQVQDRNFEVKQLALQRGKQEYDASLQLLIDKTERYDRLAQDWQSKLKQQQELTMQQNVAKVVSQLEQVSPETGKDQLMRWVDERKMDDAILLMSKMSESKLSKILKTFETQDELTKLHEIHERIIASGADNAKLEKALGELNAVDGKK
jgi:hypothetical protein